MAAQPPVSNEDRNNNVTVEDDDEKKVVLNSESVTTDPGALSYFGDEDHSKLSIRITNTEEVKGRILKHTSFIVESSLNNNITVSRRYNDFKWLHNVLSIEYLCIFVPPTPPSNTAGTILSKISAGSNQSKEFISQRRYDLERFLNRVFNNKLLAKSHSVEVFLTQPSRTRFEEQQKSIKEKLLSRTDIEIAEFIKKECFPDLDFSGAKPENDDNGDVESTADHTLYMEEIPRVREVYIRSQEKFAAMDKITKNMFKIMTNITLEIGTFNEELYGLYEIESNEKPQSMENEWQKRVEICEFVGKWKQFEQNQMYCFYKYFLLSLKFERQDCEAILDIFVRYDIVFNKYRKLCNAKVKLDKKSESVKDDGNGGSDEEVKENKQGNGDENIVDENVEMMEKIANIKLLLDVVCKIILKEQIPKLWKKRADGFNKTIGEFRKKYMQYQLER